MLGAHGRSSDPRSSRVVETMVSQAIIAERFGSPQQVLNLTTLVPPDPLPHQLTVRMTTAALNPSDLIPVTGAYPSRTPLPFIPGFEGVGVIVCLGGDCEGWSVGQRVIPIGTAGGWQTLKVMDAAQCIPVPPDVSDTVAARSYINPVTAHHMVLSYTTEATTVAVNASSSSIATILVHLLHQQGMQVVELGSRPTGSPRSLFLDTTRKGWEQALEKLGRRQVIDVAFDCVGGAEGARLAQAVRSGGTVVHYGLLSGQSLPAQLLRDRPDLMVEYFRLRTWLHAASHAQIMEAFAGSWDLARKGVLNAVPVVEMELADFRQALRMQLVRPSVGKVVLRP